MIYLLGSKVDLVDEREVDKAVAQEFCESNGIEKYFETSSVTGFNVEEVFAMAAKEMYVRDCIENAPPTPQQQNKGDEISVVSAAAGGGGKRSGKGGKNNKGTVDLTTTGGKKKE